jgi:hypothetical protein
MLHVESALPAGDIYVYRITGHPAGKYAYTGSSGVPVALLAPGVYIARTGSAVIKFAVEK